MIPLDEAIDGAASEFVAANIPMTEARRLRVQRGDILPCNLDYPDTNTQIESDVHRPSPEIDTKTRYAVDNAYIKQNLIAAGVPDPSAADLVKTYRRDRQEFDALSGPERQQKIDDGRSPESRLVRNANSLGIQGVPQFEDPNPPKIPGQIQSISNRCQMIAALTSVTPYRFTLTPSGGRMYIIPQFSFRVCQVRKIDPYSRGPGKCDNWSQVGSQQKAWLAGRYVYSAEWPDGRKARDVMNFALEGSDVHDIPMTPQK